MIARNLGGRGTREYSEGLQLEDEFLVGLVLATAIGTLALAVALAVALVAGVGPGALTVIYAASFLPVALVLLWPRHARRS